MSLTFLLLLFLLCFAFNDCNARCLTAGLGNKKIEKKCHFFPKNDDDNNSDDLSVKQLASYRNGEEAKKNKTGIVIEAVQPKVVSKRRTIIKRVFKVKKVKTSPGSLKTHESSSLVSASNWRVPHKKKGYKNPGFNLDYSPPKTHPPSHN